MPRKKLLLVVIVILAINIVVFYPRNIANALQDSIDFHSYWYSGHFVLQGSDPYEAFFQGRKPQLPIYYIDGEVTSSYPVGQEGLAQTPANTAPIVLFTSLFSLFSWPTARLLWLILNLSLALTIPWLVIRLLPSTTDSKNLNKLFILSLFLAFVSTKSVITVGQTSNIIFALMLLAILTVKRNWILSGIALGLALSKYSLSIHIVLFFLFRKKYKVVLLSLLTQIAGIAVLSFITNASPLQILYGYSRMLLIHLDHPGVNITSSLQIPSLAPYSLLLLLLFTSAVAIPTMSWKFRYYNVDIEQKISDLYILSILSIWNLLTFYHREYDMIIMILPVILLVHRANNDVWFLSKNERKILHFLIAFILLWLIRPQATVLSFLANRLKLDIETLYEISSRITTIVLLLCLALLVALLYRIRPSITVQSPVQDANSSQITGEA